MPGMRMSDTTNATFCVASSASPSAPLVAVSTVWPVGRSKRRNAERMLGSSSTSSSVAGVVAAVMRECPVRAKRWPVSGGCLWAG